MELYNIIENNYKDIKAEIKLSKLYQNNNIIKPDFQRDLDLERCNRIFENMNEYYEKNLHYKIFGTIYFCKIEEKIYLIDGQHRIRSAFMIYEKTKIDIDVDIQIYKCKNIEEIYNIFQILNFNQTIPKWMKTNIKNDIIIMKNVMEKIKLKYGDFIVINDVTVQFPKFNISKFFDVCKKYNYFQNNIDEEYIFNFIENLNDNVFLSLDKYKLNDTVNNKLQKIIMKSKFGNPIFYLGAIRLSAWDKFFKKKMYETINENIIFNLFIL